MEKKFSIQEVINKLNLDSNAQVRRSSDLRPRMALRVPLILDTAAIAENPYIISNPFNGVYVEASTGASVGVKMSLGDNSDRYSTDNYVVLYRNASFHADTEMKGCQLTWPAQAGQTITLVFFLGIDFRPGSIISQITGNISITAGTTFQTGTLGAGGISGTVNVAAATATQLCPVNTNRTAITFYTSADTWIGDSNVNVNQGVFVTGGSSFKVSNTDEVWAYSAAGTTISGVEELV